MHAPMDEVELTRGIRDSNCKHRSSAVSQALRAIQHQVEARDGLWELAEQDGKAAPYRIRVANDRFSRERAFALAHRVYWNRGFSPVAEETGLIVSSHDAHPDALTLLIEDDTGQAAATISLVLDSLSGLPCAEIYGQEVVGLRMQGRRLMEVTRLAIAEEHQHSKMLLVWLFNFAYVFARRLRSANDFLIEVHPRHAKYYQRLLRFEIAGGERPCPRVQGAPAVLMRVDLGMAEREIQRVGGKGAEAGERTLYPFLYSPQEEHFVAAFLAHHHVPMSAEERRYFRLEREVAQPQSIEASRQVYMQSAASYGIPRRP